jgi:NIMA (never in mitosis gene a)-related kinase
LRISDGIEYAMKKVNLDKLSKKDWENALNEIRILASVDHKNVIAYKEAFFDENE